MGIDYLLLTGAILLLISILIAKSAANIGIPTLLLFIGIGMLATVGVLITAIIIALFIMLIFQTSFLWGLLIGSIISSTDAAAVFSILRIGNVNLKKDLKPTLEL